MHYMWQAQAGRLMCQQLQPGQINILTPPGQWHPADAPTTHNHTQLATCGPTTLPLEDMRQARLQQVRVAQAALHILAHALVALARQRVPHVDGRVAVAAAHNRGVAAVQVLHITAQTRETPVSGSG